ncbi:hypothetical protein HKD37_20G056162 [Glycine soja]
MKGNNYQDKLLWRSKIALPMLLRNVTFLTKEKEFLMMVLREIPLTTVEIKAQTKSGHTSHTVGVCYSKHGQPLRHPRYPERPGYHNHASSGAAANNITANAVHEATKNNGNEEDSFGLSLNVAPA